MIYDHRQNSKLNKCGFMVKNNESNRLQRATQLNIYMKILQKRTTHICGIFHF